MPKNKEKGKIVFYIIYLLWGLNIDVRRTPQTALIEEVTQTKARTMRTRSLDKTCQNLLLVRKYDRRIQMFQIHLVVVPVGLRYR